MWLPAEPAVVAPELARNSPFRSKECSSFLQSKSKAQVFLGCQVSAGPRNMRTQCEPRSELPHEGFAYIC